MKRLGFIAFSFCLFSLVACAISEPNPKKPMDDDKDDAISLNPTDAKDNPIVAMETSMGTVKILLYKDKAPITVANFLKYVDGKHYDGTIFHRVIHDFMIQGGGFEPGMIPKKTKFPPIKNEAGNGLSNVCGTIAMARTGDPDSATDQFFINVADNAARGLDRREKVGGYAVFGRVIAGMNVINSIRGVRVVPNEMGEKAVPVQDVIIKSIRLIESKQE